MKLAIISLGKYETIFYFGAWIIGVFYSIYKVHLISYYFADYNAAYDDFSPGWSWIGGKRDTSDIEWALWIPFMFDIFPWTVVQLVVSQILKSYHNSTIKLSLWNLGISLVFLWRYLGVLGMLCMLIQPCIACLLVSIKSKKISCIVHLLSLGGLQMAKTMHVVMQNWLGLGDVKYQMFIIGICWMQLRCISCSIDRIDSYKHENLSSFMQDLLHSLAYCLYLPTLFLGPLILYGEFIDGIQKAPSKWDSKRSMKFLLNLLRYLFWLRFTEFSMHFLHFNVLQYHPKLVEEMDCWAFYGFGYCMGQYFLNKYVVVYGIWGEFSRADDINAPPHPKCIGRIHLYSDMWKHFDRGLYNFLIRYIYVPVSRKNIPTARVFASFLSFSFVFLWHGIQMFIFIWCLLNFIGLTVEGFARSVGNSSTYLRLEAQYLSPRNSRRFRCALAAPLLVFSATSNFYFFAGEEIGHIFMYRLFHDSFLSIGMLVFLLYCCCQVSTELKNCEKEKSFRGRRTDVLNWK
ncbi:protein-cysteine N-palmitoyltransferase Rasp [Venturia canescens]|uniref:protein-cysteine N-palmitoyltransferase Rasp n=1 Tax=Venturia canescens TaxID=32260 RepID=UPI001C9CE250|nr:protein-cysteine N-palmitoyltransferase Rasp [Venturia canescens]